MATVNNEFRRSPRQQLTHSFYGLAQAFFDFHFLHPYISAAVYVLVAVVLITGGVWSFNLTVNKRLLKGGELKTANIVFDKLATADELAEDFSEGSTEREQSSLAAQISLARFQGQDHSEEGKRITLILTYYMDAILKLPLLDQRCADARMSAMDVELAFKNQKTTGVPVSENSLLRAEAAVQGCLTKRSRYQRSTVACHDEALSYIIPQHQPPVDTCIFLHNDNVIDRK